MIPAVLLVVLVIAGITDFLFRKVYNWLTFPGMVLALILNSAAAGWPGLGYALSGLVVGGLVFFPAYWLRGMGAGDIKLMATVGAFMGWKFSLNAAVYTALAGGLAALVFLILKGELWDTLRRMVRFLSPAEGAADAPAAPPSYTLPYALVIALGSVAAYFLPSPLALP
jgi:prepilin peptidase CpaA